MLLSLLPHLAGIEHAERHILVDLPIEASLCHKGIAVDRNAGDLERREGAREGEQRRRVHVTKSMPPARHAPKGDRQVGSELCLRPDAEGGGAELIGTAVT